jgi:hypothetical protein
MKMLKRVLILSKMPKIIKWLKKVLYNIHKAYTQLDRADQDALNGI